MYNEEIVSELSANITNETIVVFGTGSVYKFIKPYFKNLNTQIECFLELNPKKESFEGKEVYALEDFNNMIFLGKKKKVLICSSIWSTLDISDNMISNLEIYVPFGEENWKLYADILPITRLEPTFNSFIERNLGVKDKEKKKEILIFLAERSGKTHPYHSMTLGIILNSIGYKVHYLFNDLSVYGDFDRGTGFVSFQNRIIENKLNLIKEKYGIHYTKISDCEKVDIDNETKNKIEHFVYYNYIWHTKKSFVKYDELYDKLNSSYINCAQRIKGFLNNNSFKLAYVWTGLHSEWSIFRIILETMKIDYVSSEYVHQGYYFSRNSPVCYQKDLIAFKDKISISIKPNKICNQSTEKGVLIPLNIFWDSAAFTDYDIFGSFSEWLTETIEFILENCKTKVYVRQHPHERHFGSGEDLKEYLLDKFGHNKNFILIDKYSSQSTYDLLSKVSVILPNTTTFGLEAVSLGKTVIVKNSVYYCEQPGVIWSNSKKDYFDKIAENIINPKIPNINERINAQKILLCKEYMYTTAEFGNYQKDLFSLLNLKLEDILNIDSIKLAINVFDNGKTILENNLKINQLT